MNKRIRKKKQKELAYKIGTYILEHPYGAVARNGDSLFEADSASIQFGLAPVQIGLTPVEDFTLVIQSDRYAIRKMGSL